MIISIVNTKGGVGKTTLTASLAVRAAKDFKRVCMVDLDPQRSLVQWWNRRGSPTGPHQPEVLAGLESAEDAVEAIKQTGWDYCFLDGPPAFLVTVQEMVQASDFVLIPVKPSMLDLLATQDAVVLTRQAGTPHMVVINDAGVGETKVLKSIKHSLFNSNIPIAETILYHRVSHIAGMTVGKSAAEVDNGKDAKAAAEIDALWQEVKSAASKAAKAAQKVRVANVG